MCRNQKRIVDILGKCEMIIRLRTRELELLDNLIKARFVEMFGCIHDGRFDMKTLLEIVKIFKNVYLVHKLKIKMAKLLVDKITV